MREARQHPKPSPASLIPTAVIAVAVVVLALVVAGKKATGTIVVERITMNFATATHGKTIHPRSLSVTTINETSAGGIEQRSFTSSSFTRPGFEQVFAGDMIQLYDPVDNTVYVTTEQGEQRAIVAQVRRTAPKGAHVSVGVGKMQLVSASANSVGYVPGRTSVYENWLRDGSYKLVGHDPLDGRAALKLVEASPTRGPNGVRAAEFVSAPPFTSPRGAMSRSRRSTGRNSPAFGRSALPDGGPTGSCRPRPPTTVSFTDRAPSRTPASSRTRWPSCAPASAHSGPRPHPGSPSAPARRSCRGARPRPRVASAVRPSR